MIVRHSVILFSLPNGVLIIAYHSVFIILFTTKSVNVILIVIHDIFP